jgi:hypothetical protein
MSTTRKARTTSPVHPLVGKHFHTISKKKVNYQGRTLEYLGDGRFLAVLYEWLSGTKNYGQYIFELESFTWDEAISSGTVFYDSAKEMNEAYENRWSRFQTKDQK